MSDSNNQSFIRWQGRTIEQLGFVNNLIIGLSTGMLAFEIQLAFTISFVSFWEKRLLFLSPIILFVSIVAGCYLAWTRLISFRTTMKIARKREKGELGNIDKFRKHAELLGNRTWRILSWQIISFLLGSLMLLISSAMMLAP